jgi:hypothetical protein
MTEPGAPTTPATPGGVVVSSAQEPARRSILGAAWSALCAAIGAVMGLFPHVLHHVTLIAGAALVTGLGGNLIFAALGLLFSVPLLRRLYRRFGTWKAPAVAVAVFATMFSLTAFVIGPALTSSGAQQPAPRDTPAGTDHSAHHEG